jgi:hypothetical protein
VLRDPPLLTEGDTPDCIQAAAPDVPDYPGLSAYPADVVLLDLFAILVAVFIAMHGIGHAIWFLAAWTTIGAGVGDGPWGLPGAVTIRSPLGRLWGALALVTLVLFLGAALALLAGALAWRGLAFLGIGASFVAVGPWRGQSPGSTWLMAILADLVLLVLLSLPVSLELTDAI